MTTAEAILVGVLLFMSVMATIAGYYISRPFIWLLAAIVWVLTSVYANGLSAAAWDVMYVLFFVGAFLFLCCLMMAIQGWRFPEEETAEKEEKEPPQTDVERYMDETGRHRSEARQFSEATGGRKANRRRRRFW